MTCQGWVPRLYESLSETTDNKYHVQREEIADGDKQVVIQQCAPHVRAILAQQIEPEAIASQADAAAAATHLCTIVHGTERH